MLKRISGLACLIGICLISACAVPFAGPDNYSAYLVRHAEKEPGRDPALSPEGRVRASALAERLAEAGLEVIFSTDFARTRETAGPIALKLGLPVLYYDPRNLEGLAEQIRTERRTALVVGHSNTTPGLAAALGGEAGGPITEATEYDRLYVLHWRGAELTSEIERYGTPSPIE